MQSRAERSVGFRSVDGDSTSDDPAEESDRRHDPDTTLGNADTVGLGELDLAELWRGPASETVMEWWREKPRRPPRRADLSKVRSRRCRGGRTTGRNDEATSVRLYFPVLPYIKNMG